MKKSDRIRIEAPHDTHHGEEGVVIEVKEHTATVELDNGIRYVYGVSALVLLS